MAFGYLMYICKFRGYCPEQGSGNIKLTFPNLVAGAKGLPVDNCSIRSWVGVTLSRIVEVCYLDSKAKSLNVLSALFFGIILVTQAYLVC